MLTINALTASHWLFIPLQAQFLALKGLTGLWAVVEKVQKRLNNGLRLGGSFLTQYDRRKTLDRRVREAAAARFPESVLQTAIRSNVALAEAPAAAQDIFRYAPLSHGAQDYAALIEEMLGRMKE